MKAWLPVYKFEEKYEVNIIDGIVREIVKDVEQPDKILTNVSIDETIGDTPKFLGYGVVLLDKDNQEHLYPLDKIIVEALLKRNIDKPIYRKNGFLIDCNYNNLTFTPPPLSTKFVPATESGSYYQYKRVTSTENGISHQSYVFDKKFETYKEFEKHTGLSIADFYQDDEPTERVRIGIYMWSTRELVLKPQASQHNSCSLQMANA